MIEMTKVLVFTACSATIFVCGGCLGIAKVSIERSAEAPALSEFPVVVVTLSGVASEYSHGFVSYKNWDGIFVAKRFVSQMKYFCDEEDSKPWFMSQDEEFIAKQSRFLRIEFHEEKTWVIPRLSARLHWFTNRVSCVKLRLFDTNATTPFASIDVDFLGNTPPWGGFPFSWTSIRRDVMTTYITMESGHERKKSFSIIEQ